jgi:hypothetical protein
LKSDEDDGRVVEAGGEGLRWWRSTLQSRWGILQNLMSNVSEYI